MLVAEENVLHSLEQHSRCLFQKKRLLLTQFKYAHMRDENHSRYKLKQHL